MSDYLASPALQGVRQRAYRAGLASGRRAGSSALMDDAYLRWQRRWEGRVESLAWRDWLDGFKDGVSDA